MSVHYIIIQNSQIIEQLRCPTTDEKLNRMLHICIMDPTQQRNEPIHTITGMNLDNILNK